MITVRHSAGSYSVHFEPIERIAELLPDGCHVITDTNVGRLYGSLFQRFAVHEVPAGESSKQIESYAKVVAWLVDSGARRRSTVVALGGGVVGDLAGFVAATYMRGVRLIQIPTSLLAQVDSSVGGKVGIDLPQGKNLVGAFAPPESVYIPVEVLRTLPEREFAAGMAEVCKYGFIMDEQLAAQLSLEKASYEAMPNIVERCIRHKAYVVEEDEFETKGLRAILNFGHTVGHAIEQVTGYGPVLHGEAIAVGMRVEAELAERLGVAERGLADAVDGCLSKQGLRTRLDLHLDRDALMAAMRKDKKRVGSGIPFSLVESMGRCKLYEDVAEADVEPLLGDL